MSHAVILTYRTTLGKQGTESTGVSAVVQRCTTGKSSYKEFQHEYRLNCVEVHITDGEIQQTVIFALL